MKKTKIIFAFALLLSLIINIKLPAQAADKTDLIHNYDITVDVLEDASVNITYHIVWEVLESDKAGALSWVQLGIPNGKCKDYYSDSPNVESVVYAYAGGHYLDIYFTDNYYKGDIVEFDVTVTQDYLYETDAVTEGETLYTFTPGWFDEIDVESMTLRWNNENAASFSPSCLIEDGYMVWEQPLKAGEKFTIKVSYPNDAYNFVTYVTELPSTTPSSYSVNTTYPGSSNYNSYSSSSSDTLADVVVPIFFIFIASIIVLAIKSVGAASYSSGSGLSSPTETKIVRKIVTYYPTCQGCGAVRPDGTDADKCAYCGRSFIKSEETVEESKIEHPEEYKEEGTYRYGNRSHTYVHVTHIPVLKHSSDYHHSYGSRSSSSFHSSCVHSSCACACACACAGGGRAGCSTKDFYNTNLKLSQLKKKNK